MNYAFSHSVPPGSKGICACRQARSRFLTFTNIGIATICATTEKIIKAEMETS